MLGCNITSQNSHLLSICWICRRSEDFVSETISSAIVSAACTPPLLLLRFGCLAGRSLCPAPVSLPLPGSRRVACSRHSRPLVDGGQLAIMLRSAGPALVLNLSVSAVAGWQEYKQANHVVTIVYM